MHVIKLGSTIFPSVMKPGSQSVDNVTYRITECDRQKIRVFTLIMIYTQKKLVLGIMFPENELGH